MAVPQRARRYGRIGLTELHREMAFRLPVSSNAPTILDMLGTQSSTSRDDMTPCILQNYVSKRSDPFLTLAKRLELTHYYILPYYWTRCTFSINTE